MPTFTRGSTVYLKAAVIDKQATTIEDATLDGTVEFSLDGGTTWDPAEWDGEVYMRRVDNSATKPARNAKRTALLVLDDDTAASIPVQVRVTDSPEIYLIKGLAASVK